MKKNIKFILIILVSVIFLVSAAVGILLPDNTENKVSTENNETQEKLSNDNESANNTTNNTIDSASTKNSVYNNTYNNVSNNVVNKNNTNTVDNTNETSSTNSANSNIQTKNKYSNDQLEKMALDYYEKVNGSKPGNAKASERVDGKIAIQLYDSFDDHNSTVDWYTVDPNTGKGENVLGEEIDIVP